MSELHGPLPWTKSCFVCGESNPDGLRQKSRVEEGVVIIDYTTRPSDVGYKEYVHGGIAMTLLDEVMTWAAILATKKMCVAAELTTRLRRPLRVGQVLRVEGRAVRSSSRLCLTEGTILDEHGEVMLTASGKYMPMAKAQADLSEKDFVYSPDVIDPLKIMEGN